MIEFKNVVFQYNNVDGKVLDDVSFVINDGEWISIIGHNGSGKSTLAKLMIGIVEANSGEILYDGIPLSLETVNGVRKRVGIVFQNPDNQFVGYNVKYDIAFGLENHKVPRADMIDLINEYTEKVGMLDELEREPQTLSGGQKQRVAIAGILALNCDIIILDEATSMLDPEGVVEITKLIWDLKYKYNKTVITITHDLDIAKKSDRVIILKEGKILESGRPSDVFMHRDVLLSSNLDMPFSLRFYDEAQKIDCLKQDEKLMEALWEYHLKK